MKYAVYITIITDFSKTFEGDSSKTGQLFRSVKILK